MPRPVVTDAHIDEMCTLREASVPVSRISQKLGLNPKTVDYHLRKRGVFPPGHQHRGDVRRRRSYTDKNGRTVRQFTPEEDARLEQLDIEGKSLSQIARALNRRENSVRARLTALANRQQLEEGL